jgi:hypothetical protein
MKYEGTVRFIHEHCISQGKKCPLQLLLTCLCLLNDFPDDLRGIPALFRKICVYISRLSPNTRDSLFDNLPCLLNIDFTNNSIHPQCTPMHTPDARSIQSPLSPLDLSLFVSFSTSKIWTTQQSFYRTQNIHAWDNVVPFQISTNSFVAKQYSENIFNFCCMQNPELLNDSTQKLLSVCVVEIGAGHGKLSYLISQELERAYADQLHVHTVATDFHDSVFKEIQNLPWIDRIRSRLQFKVFNDDTIPIDEETTSSIAQDQSLERYDIVIIIGNYVFDSLPVDLLTSDNNGMLYELVIQADSTSTDSFITVPVDRTNLLTSRAISEDIIEHIVSHPYQVFPLPIGGIRLLTQIRDYYTVKLGNTGRSTFGLIVGDSAFSNDDPTWRCESLVPNTTVKLSLPFISPSKVVVALPITPAAIQLAFKLVFKLCTVHSKTSSNNNSFSCEFVHNQQQIPHPQIEPVGPAEFQVVTELLSSANVTPPLDCLFDYLTLLSHNDIASFLQVMWSVKRGLCTLNIASSYETSPRYKRIRLESSLHLNRDAWADVAMTCLRRHYCSSWLELLTLRARMMQWLSSLDLYERCLHLFTAQGIEESTGVCVSAVVSRVCITLGASKLRGGLHFMSITEAYLGSFALQKLEGITPSITILRAVVDKINRGDEDALRYLRGGVSNQRKCNSKGSLLYKVSRRLKKLFLVNLPQSGCLFLPQTAANV